MHDTVFLFDVDNTLLDNDRVQADMDAHHRPRPTARRRATASGRSSRNCARELGYADYLGALERYRLEDDARPAAAAHGELAGGLSVRRAAVSWRARRGEEGAGTGDDRGVCRTATRCSSRARWRRSGLWPVFGDNVLIYVHKELELADVERPLPRQALCDDRRQAAHPGYGQARLGRPRHHGVPAPGTLRERPREVAKYPPADLTVERIGDLLEHDLAALAKR